MKQSKPNPQPAIQHESVRGANRANFLRVVSDHPNIDRTLIAELVGLTTPAVTRISQELMSAGLLIESGAQKSAGRGRKRQSLRLNHDGGVVLGVSVLAFNTGVTLCNLAGDVVAHEEVVPSDLTNPTTTLDEIAAAAHRIVDRHVINRQRLIGVGVAIAGYLDATGEIWKHSPYLGWPEFNIKRSLADRLELPIAIENVNRAIAVAETNIGVSRNAQDVFLIRAALGLGGALISNDRLSRGHRNMAGQIGHIPARLDGKRCSCGKFGCLTTEASGLAILQQLKLSVGSESNLADLQKHGDLLRGVLEKAEGGCARTTDVLTAAGAALGYHSASPILVFDPEVVVLTGPLGRSPAYCRAFCDQLRAAGVAAEIKCGDQHDIMQPAEAAAGLALSSHFFSSTLDIAPLIESANADAGHIDAAEGAIVL